MLREGRVVVVVPTFPTRVSVRVVSVVVAAYPQGPVIPVALSRVGVTIITLMMGGIIAHPARGSDCSDSVDLPSCRGCAGW
jgi:hypothetical protein